MPSDPEWSGGSIYSDLREQRCRATPERLWRVVEGIGGEQGWYSFPLAWSVRGRLDRIVGGVGLRRGRRDPHAYWWAVSPFHAVVFGGMARNSTSTAEHSDDPWSHPGRQA
jgi:hypothetical protein